MIRTEIRRAFCTIVSFVPLRTKVAILYLMKGKEVNSPMGKNFARKAICMILALSLVLGTAAMAFAATSPASGKLSNRGDALTKANNQKVITLNKNVTKISKKAFSKAKKVRVIKIKTKKKVYVHKKAFKGLKKSQLKKIKVKVNKKMSKKNFKKLRKKLVKLGFKKKNIKRNLTVK